MKKYKPVQFYLLVTLACLCTCCKNTDVISLHGQWQFRIDSLDMGMKDAWYTMNLADVVVLPGSMLTNGKGNDLKLHTRWTGSIYDSSWFFRADMEKYRQPGNLKFPFWLTPAKHYVGAAWYRREVEIPAGWKSKRIVLFLERVHTESRLWVDDREIGMQNSLVAPHVYDITAAISPGRHTLTLCIDNRIKEINVGPDSHSITDHTQGNWNGIIGRIELQATPLVWLDDIQVYPGLANKQAMVKILLKNRSGENARGKIVLQAESYNSERKHRVKSLKTVFSAEPGEEMIEIKYPMGETFLQWDEFDPALYKLRVMLSVRKGIQEERVVSFGMREFRISGTRFTVNGRPVFLRGNVDCAGFPLTGYPPMDVASWKKLFGKLKEYGMNHVRYHSWCPPEAAFQAADEAGFYLQPEGPSWCNHGTSLGDGKPVDQYIYDETNRMATCYGNHPSFVMMAYGNEPAGRHQVEYLGKFVKYWQAKDNRRVYTSAAVGTSWPWVEEVEYIVKSNPRNIPWNDRPNSCFDFREKIKGRNKPWVSHEVGQYCVFPNFDEIKKYTGAYKAANFELFKEELEKHDMGDQAKDFLLASGRLQVLTYKHELEAALRTPGFAGFQMLQLNDFSGQGTALVGVLDAFFEEKGYTDAKEWRKFCNSTVPLARISKFVYNNDETFNADLEMFHFGGKPMEQAVVRWKISDAGNKEMAGGSFVPDVIPVDNAFFIGTVSFPLSGIRQPGRYRLEVKVENGEFMNDWDFWVYPRQLPDADTHDIYITDTFNKQAEKTLKEGGKVLLLAAGKVERGKEVIMHFKPVFWNTSWFQMRPPHVTGILCRNEHPVFTEFPTASHSDLQWWELLQMGQVMILDDFPSGFRPIIQPIDTWFLNRRLGSLFEAKVGNGKLVVCSLDLTSDPDDRPVARQLLYGIKKYMASQQFDPEYTVDQTVIYDLFEVKDREKYNPFTRSSTQELIPVQQKK